MSQPKPNQSSSSSRLKSRITLKNLKTSGSATATRTTDNNLFTNAESTMATLEGAAREIHYMSPIYFINQEDATLHESSEESQKSYRNMFVDPQSSPHAVYRSTLANLSDGLATLNEGDYIRWENDKDQKNGNISLMPPKYGGGLVKRQRPLSMHIFAQAESSNNSRTGTPNSRDMGPQKGKRNHVRAVRNRGIGEIDPKTYKRNYDSVIEYPHKQGSTSNNDSRWKGCGSMNEALEILKTEESIEALKKIHREEGESSECVPLVVLKEKYQRSTSVKNRRPLTQEFEEWKTTLMGRKEALLERREIKKKEKCAQEPKKEDMVLPKLNIGGDGLIVMPEKRDKERETVKHNSNFGEMRKTKLKWGISRPHSSKKKVLSIQSKENREIVKNKSQGPQEMQQVDQHEEVKPGRETTPIRNIRRLKCQGSASMVVWDEESLLQNMEPRYTEDRRWQTEEKGHSDQPKLKGLVPKLKIKQDFIMKQQLILVRSRAESRERSREKSKDYKYDVEKIIKGHKEGLNRLLPNGMPEYYNVGHENSVEVCTAQTILDQRMRALEDKYVRKDEGSPERDHVRTSPEPKKILKAGSLDVEGSHRREGSGRTQRVSFVLSTKKIGNAKSML